MATLPDDYWTTRRHYYFRDLPAWGVRDAKRNAVVVSGLDKSVAAAVACLLNGDIAYAGLFLAYLPEHLDQPGHG